MQSIHAMRLGCDPEFFFTKDGKVVGSEKAIPEVGFDTGGARLVRDGVQVEINPAPDTCRAYLVNNIAQAFRQIAKVMSEKGLEASFDRRIKMDREELLSLAPEARQLGCAPSISHYDKNFDIAKLVRGRVTKGRSAGGHIHIGVDGYSDSYQPYEAVRERVDQLIPLLDVVVGNTWVIWDKDPSNATRRKLYGRAGECRLPSHGGVEYRTLSNFWLQHEALVSLVFGMVRWAASVVIDNAHTKTILDCVDPKDIVRAINKNDVDLATSNWEKVKPVVKEVCGTRGGITVNNGEMPFHEVDIIDHFIRKGQEHWWPSATHDVVKHWISIPEGHQIGWGEMRKTVIADMRKEKVNVEAHLQVS